MHALCVVVACTGPTSPVYLYSLQAKHTSFAQLSVRNMSTCCRTYLALDEEQKMSGRLGSTLV